MATMTIYPFDALGVRVRNGRTLTETRAAVRRAVVRACSKAGTVITDDRRELTMYYWQEGGRIRVQPAAFIRANCYNRGKLWGTD